MNKKSLVFIRGLIFVLAIGFTGFFVFDLISANPDGNQSVWSWADFYQIIALMGSVAGFFIAKKWGGLKSLLGRAVFVISLGLFFQNIGQTIFSIYAILWPSSTFYPSLADIGFFGSVIFYIYGAYLLCKVLGVHIAFRSYKTKILVFLVPTLILAGSYLVFLKDYSADLSNPIKVFLDFGYPLGQALYISIALLAYIVSKNSLGGVMRGALLTLLFALFLQYAADFNFLFQSTQDSWVLAGSYGDFLYLVSYTCMAYALVRFGFVSDYLANNK